MINRHLRRSALGALVVCALLATGTSMPGSAQNKPLSVLLEGNSSGTNSAGFSISHEAQPGGYTISSVSKGRIEVRVSAPTGSTLKLPDTSVFESLPKEGGIEVGVLTPKESPALTTDTGARVVRSVITEQMELGMDYETAVREYAGLLDPSEAVPTKAEAEAIVNAPYRSDSTASAGPAAAVCKNIYIDGNMKSHGCDNQTYKKTEAGKKYYTHSMKISSQYDSFWSALDYTYIDTAYMEAVSPLTNWVDWDPYQKINRSGCGQVTLTASAFGLSVSSTNEACKSSISPRFGTQKFGVIWNGLSSYWRGAHGVGIVQVPSGKDTQRYIATHMHWRIK